MIQRDRYIHTYIHIEIEYQLFEGGRASLYYTISYSSHRIWTYCREDRMFYTLYIYSIRTVNQ